MSSRLKKWPIFDLLPPEFVSKIHMVLVYGDFANSCLIATKDQTVYALRNGSYNFMKKDEINGESAVCLKSSNSPCGQKIKTMAFGKGSYVLVLTENGKVYSWGSWNNTVTTDKLNCCCHCAPRNIKLNGQNESVMDIACGNYHSIALTETGNIYAWGDSDSFRVTWIKHSEPQIVSLGGYGVRFRSISCGAIHCVAVTLSGYVYIWNSNSYGVLNHQSQTVNLQANLVTFPFGIVIEKVACGLNHTLALTGQGTLYSWGDNTYGQLGTSLEYTMSSSPIEVKHLPKVFDIATCSTANMSVAIGIDYQIFMWGECVGYRIDTPTLISVDSIHDAFALYASPRAMHQPFVLDVTGTEEVGVKTMNIMHDLMAAFDDKTTNDLTMEVQGKPIYVHKAILKIRSKYFNAMFQRDWKENNDSVIRISEFSYVAYRAFLKFLYTNKIDTTIPTENILELLQLADRNDEYNVKASCTGILTQRIATANAALFYSEAVQYNNPVLRRSCIRFAVTHMIEISKSLSFSELPKELMKNFIIEVGDQGAFIS